MLWRRVQKTRVLIETWIERQPGQIGDLVILCSGRQRLTAHLNKQVLQQQYEHRPHHQPHSNRTTLFRLTAITLGQRRPKSIAKIDRKMVFNGFLAHIASPVQTGVCYRKLSYCHALSRLRLNKPRLT